MGLNKENYGWKFFDEGKELNIEFLEGESGARLTLAVIGFPPMEFRLGNSHCDAIYRMFLKGKEETRFGDWE